ncbi:glycosyl hydrolase family 61-domain-containing protein [Rhizoctonia solani]|nr:glycosyl hydrolase family 61-domain-containing protein [Rhizoctonia solani]
MLFSSVLSVLALAVSSVNAHGYIKELVADGKTYKGPVAGSGKTSSPIRQISTTSPYKDVNGPGMTCGRDAKTASLIADVTAGSTIKMSWEDHPGDTWNHDLGPLMTYMTKVPSGQTADKFNPSGASWFKVAQAGIGSNGKWAQASLMSGAFHSVTIPKNIPSGQYIMRHEIIALHLADKRGGVEFYGGCIQFNVKGGTGGANFLNGVATAKFPGGYKLDDKGIHVNVFNKGFKYTFPGPAIASFSSSGASVKASANSTNTSDDDETTSSSTTKPKPTSTGKSSSKDKDNTNKGKNTRSWTSRMHKRYLGSLAAPAPHGRASE